MYREIASTDHSLRPYQQQAKEEIFAAWDEHSSIMFQMPTGTGKTRLFTSIIRDIKIWNITHQLSEKILIIAHRVELIEQISDSLQHYGIAHGLIIGGKPRDLTKQVQVASIQTITHHSNATAAQDLPVGFVIIDEAHHSMARSYQRLWQMYPDSLKLGVTATPWRMNGEGFTTLYDCLIPSAPISRFIQEGWLAPYSYYSISPNDHLHESISRINEFDAEGDYKVSALERTVDTLSIRAKLIKSYLALAKGRKGIIYAISRKHSEHICSEFRAAGVNIVRIDSFTSRNERRLQVSRFKQGLIDVIVNVDIFSEGFDCPDIEFIQLARPTRSLAKYLQQVGRGLRHTKGKRKCIILDNVGAHLSFGFPDSEHDWQESFIGSSNEPRSHKHSESLHPIVYTEPDETLKEEGNEEMLLVEDLALPERPPLDSHSWTDTDLQLLRLLHEERHCPASVIAPVFGCTEEEIRKAILSMNGE